MCLLRATSSISRMEVIPWDMMKLILKKKEVNVACNHLDQDWRKNGPVHWNVQETLGDQSMTFRIVKQRGKENSFKLSHFFIRILISSNLYGVHFVLYQSVVYRAREITGGLGFDVAPRVTPNPQVCNVYREKLFTQSYLKLLNSLKR